MRMLSVSFWSVMDVVKQFCLRFTDLSETVLTKVIFSDFVSVEACVTTPEYKGFALGTAAHGKKETFRHFHRDKKTKHSHLLVTGVTNLSNCTVSVVPYSPNQNEVSDALLTLCCKFSPHLNLYISVVGSRSSRAASTGSRALYASMCVQAVWAENWSNTWFSVMIPELPPTNNGSAAFFESNLTQPKMAYPMCDLTWILSHLLRGGPNPGAPYVYYACFWHLLVLLLSTPTLNSWHFALWWNPVPQLFVLTVKVFSQKRMAARPIQLRIRERKIWIQRKRTELFKQFGFLNAAVCSSVSRHGFFRWRLFWPRTSLLQLTHSKETSSHLCGQVAHLHYCRCFFRQVTTFNFAWPKRLTEGSKHHFAFSRTAKNAKPEKAPWTLFRRMYVKKDPAVRVPLQDRNQTANCYWFMKLK